MVLVCQSGHNGIVDWMNIRCEVKTQALHRPFHHVTKNDEEKVLNKQLHKNQPEYLDAQHERVPHILLVPLLLPCSTVHQQLIKPD